MTLGQSGAWVNGHIYGSCLEHGCQGEQAIHDAVRFQARANRIEALAREACEAEFTSERLAAMQRLREALACGD